MLLTIVHYPEKGLVNSSKCPRSQAELNTATIDRGHNMTGLPARHCWGSSCFGPARSAGLWWGLETACSPAGRIWQDCPPASWRTWPMPLDSGVCLLTGGRVRRRGSLVFGVGSLGPWGRNSPTVWGYVIPLAAETVLLHMSLYSAPAAREERVCTLSAP